ncbi:hypothetical protein HS088_TW15G01238 [Tripterygium wilfordii]|uniref:Uncharacterized protein n=1 Tax=Tripterygium wilfordii TaxID=458696 RepID=A0A7J7CNR0_TRIWF|nr:hypothetical protein HS088_TW15G01238 [Tripterygium wilfordii]
MGYMLWTPSLVPKGCFINNEEGHQVLRCRSEEALHRAKSLVNIEFSWFLVLITVLGVGFYLVLVRIYGEKVEYSTLRKEEEEEEEADVESQKKPSKLDVARSFIQMGQAFGPIDMERSSQYERLTGPVTLVDCYQYYEDGRLLVACHTEEALHRAKSLVNIQFSSYLILITILCTLFYLILTRIYRNKRVAKYLLLTKGEEGKEEEEDSDEDVEFQKPSKLGES